MKENIPQLEIRKISNLADDEKLNALDDPGDRHNKTNQTFVRLRVPLIKNLSFKVFFL